MTRAGGAWSLSINWIPIYIPASLPSASLPEKKSDYPWFSRQKVPPLSPLSPCGFGWTHQKSSSPKDKPWEDGKCFSKHSSKIYKPHILLRFSRAPRSQNHSRIFRAAQLQKWHLHELSLQMSLNSD